MPIRIHPREPRRPTPARAHLQDPHSRSLPARPPLPIRKPPARPPASTTRPRADQRPTPRAYSQDPRIPAPSPHGRRFPPARPSLPSRAAAASLPCGPAPFPRGPRPLPRPCDCTLRPRFAFSDVSVAQLTRSRTRPSGLDCAIDTLVGLQSRGDRAMRGHGYAGIELGVMGSGAGMACSPGSTFAANRRMLASASATDMEPNLNTPTNRSAPTPRSLS